MSNAIQVYFIIKFIFLTNAISTEKHISALPASQVDSISQPKQLIYLSLVPGNLILIFFCILFLTINSKTI